MAEKRTVRGHQGRWKRLAIVAAVATMAILTTQGCCSVLCPNYNKRQVIHTVSIADSMVTPPCSNTPPNCVCPVPVSVKVRPGDKIRFVNTTDFNIKIQPSSPGALTPSGDIEVDAKTWTVVEVEDPIPSSLGNGITLIYHFDPPSELCRDLPGPGVDWD